MLNRQIYAQAPSLALASGSTAKGGSVSLNLSFNAASQSTASLEWTLTYPTAGVTSVTAATGTALAADGKNLSCNSGVGTLVCLASGANATAIGSGVVAVVTATLSPGSSATLNSLSMSNVFGALANGTDADVTGSGGTISVTATTTVSGLQCTPTSLSSGVSSSCTVSLSQAAPTGGALITISDNNSSLSVPASATVAAGATSATFQASAQTISSSGSAVITASYSGSSATASVSLVAPSVSVSAVSCNPTSLSSNASTTCTVTLNQSAPTGGAVIALSDTNAALKVPASVTVAAAATSASFTATTAAISSNSSATITASYNSSSATASVSLVAPSVSVSAVSCNPTSLSSNASTTCTVTLNQSAPTGGAVIALSDTNAALKVPASVTVAAAATSATFTATTAANSSNSSATITATYSSSSATASVSLVAPSVSVSAVSCNPTSLSSNASATCTVTLNQSAPTDGAVIALSNTNATLQVPASVTVAAAATSATFTATTAAISGNSSATITASYNSSSANTTVNLVTSVLVSSLICSPSSIGANSSSICTIHLTQPAPAGGASVTLSNSNPALTVAPSFTVAAAATSTSLLVTTAAVSSNSSATITATYNGSSATASVSLVAPVVQVSSLACNPTSLGPNSASTCTVTLTQAAPAGGASVSLSNNNSTLTVPASATVAAAATSATFNATTATISSNSNATITATSNSSSATASVSLVAPVIVSSLACNPTSLRQSSSSTCTVTLAQAAPTGGLSVALTNTNPTLTVPPSVTVAAAATSSTFNATTTTIPSNQNATITATLGSSSQTATISLLATGLVSGVVCNPASLGQGATSTCTVTLAQPAPAGGSNVALASNNGSLSVSQTPTYVNNQSCVGWSEGSPPAVAVCNVGTVNTGDFITVFGAHFGSTGTMTVTDNCGAGGASDTYAALDGPTVGALTESFTATVGAGRTSCTIHISNTALQTQQGVVSVARGVEGIDAHSAINIKSTGTGSNNAVSNPIVLSSSDLILGMSIDVWGTAGTYTAGTSSTPTWTLGNQTGFTGTSEHGTQTNGSVTADLTYSNAHTDTATTAIALKGPASVTVAAGATTASFNISAAASIASNQSATVTATLGGSSATTSVSLVAGGAEAKVAAAIVTARTTPVASNGGTSSVLSTLSCAPKLVTAGAQATCELRVAATPTPGQIQIATNSQSVNAPTAVGPRPNQARLTFQVSTAAAAARQLVTVIATQGGETVQDIIQVDAGSHPVLTVPKRQSAKPGTPLRFEVTGADPNPKSVNLAASNLPAGATFDNASGRFEWTPLASQRGTYKVQFTVTNQMGESSSAQVGIDVTSGEPAVALAQGACSPGATASVTGSWLSAQGEAPRDPSGNSTELGGTKVTVNGQYVAVLSASSNEVQFLCPALMSETTLQVAVETDAGVSGSIRMPMESASPRLFTLGDSAPGQGVVSFSNTSELAMARNFQVPAHPAQPGDEIVLWGTGFGPAAQVNGGQIAVKVGNVAANVDAVQAVPGHAGVYTVQVRVPASTVFGDSVPVQLQVTGGDGRSVDSNTVAIAIEPSLQ